MKKENRHCHSCESEKGLVFNPKTEYDLELNGEKIKIYGDGWKCKKCGNEVSMPDDVDPYANLSFEVEQKALGLMPANKFCSVTDAASSIGIARQNVLKAIKAKRIRALKKGNDWWPLIRDVDRYERKVSTV